MRLFSIQNLPPQTGPVRVCKYSVYLSLIWVMVWVGCAAGCFWLAEQGGYYEHGWSVPASLLQYAGGLSSLATLVALWQVKKAYSVENWLLRISDDKVLVKFRSYLNAHFGEDDLVIVELQWREIDWCRVTKETVTSPGTDIDTTRTVFKTYLDLKLKTGDWDSLRSALQAERNRKAPLAGKTRLTHHHYPVALTENGILRLDWGQITPRMGRVIKSLSGKIDVESSLKLKPRDLNQAEGKDLEDAILNMAQNGEVVQAVKLVRVKYDKSLTEAKEFVDELLVP